MTPPRSVRSAPWERAPWERPYRWQPPRPPRAEPVRIPPVQVEPKPSDDNSNRRLIAATGSIAIATLVSRITGFLKQMLLLTVLGGAVASSYTVASQIPNMISELVLGAVLTTCVVPVLIRAEREDADRGAAFIRRLFTAAFTLLGIAALLATAAAPVLTTHVFLSNDGKVDTSLTTALSFLLLPSILFYGMSALLMAILNTRQVFKPGAWAPVLNNLVVLAVLGLYLVVPGDIELNPVRMSDPKLLVLGLGVLAGVITQAVSLVPAIRREGIDLRPLWGIDARLKQFGGIAIAIVLYVLISQTGFVFATRVSSGADAAGPAIYNNAWLLLQLPYGVLGVTLLTAIMPRLSRNAAANDTPAVVDDLSVATRLTMIALVPVITFLTFAGPQVGEALYGYGNFSGDASRLGQAVSWSAFTLIPYSIVLIHLRVFYAREQVWTPTWIILGITGVKIALSALAPIVATDDHQVVNLLGVANGIGFIGGAIIGGILLRRSLGDLRMANVGRTVWVVLLASLAGGLAMYGVDRLLNLRELTVGLGGLGSVLRVAFGGLFMLSITFAIMRIANVSEIVAITVAIRRRLSGRSDEVVEDNHGDNRADESEYDPMMDAQTMVIPVIRANAVDITGVGEFPYPVRQRLSTQPYGGYDRGYLREGVRVSDDAIAGGVPAGSSAAEASEVQTPADQAGGVSTDTVAADLQKATAAQPAPPRSPAEATAPVETESPPHEGGPRPIPRGPKLIPGASVAGGRYRLLAAHGGSRGLKFWQALDTKLDREVALTFVDSEQTAGLTDTSAQGPQAILSRTLRLGRINSPGLARVLDVVRGSSGGIVVAEWTPGRSLREMAETKPSPIGAARAIRALAAAAELTHRGGGALSIDHPDRVRISANGDAVLAFPGTLADADAQADVRGLGAMLYALIIARWPIGAPPGGITGTAVPAAKVGGLPLAAHGADGAPIEPREIRPEVPFEISAVAVRALETNRGVRTAATVQHVLEQASVVDQKTDMIPALRLGQRQPGSSGHALADPEEIAAEKARSNRMMLILAGLGVVTVIVLGLVGWWLANFLAGGGSNEPLNNQLPGLTSQAAVPSDETGAAPAPAGVPVPASDVEVFSPQGTPDSVGSVNLVLDNNPSTVWRTDAYFQPFPALKKGVGLLATLPKPTVLNNVWINSPTPGTKVEIRTSPTASPTLDQTQVIGTATLGQGVTQIPVETDQPVRYVLVWITGLSKSGSQNQSAIADMGFTAGS